MYDLMVLLDLEAVRRQGQRDFRRRQFFCRVRIRTLKIPLSNHYAALIWHFASDILLKIYIL